VTYREGAGGANETVRLIQVAGSEAIAMRSRSAPSQPA
jgi:hypothetical protein